MVRPLFPEDGFLYDVAMMEAQELYDEWVASRKGRKQGITVYTRKQEDKE